MDLETVKLSGEKLAVMPDDVGVDSEQFTAQQRRLAKTPLEVPLFLALSQQDIILSFGACKGVPEATPPITAKSKNNNVNRLTIRLNIGRCR